MAAELLAVSADSANDAWAVGDSYQPSNSVNHTLAEHWNGQAWTRLATIDPGTDQQLNGVAAISPKNVWAVGFTNSSGWWANRTLVEHWNGSAWRWVPSPSPTSGEDELWGVWASSATDVWAVGDAGGQTLIEHWNGTSWAVVPSPNRITTGSQPLNALDAVTTLPGGLTWATGSYQSGNASGTLVLRNPSG
jgi:hypothetical protein